MTRVLVARQDNLGDVLLAGPCVRVMKRQRSWKKMTTCVKRLSRRLLERTSD